MFQSSANISGERNTQGNLAPRGSLLQKMASSRYTFRPCHDGRVSSTPCRMSFSALQKSMSCSQYVVCVLYLDDLLLCVCKSVVSSSIHGNVREITFGIRQLYCSATTPAFPELEGPYDIQGVTGVAQDLDIEVRILGPHTGACGPEAVYPLGKSSEGCG